VTARMSDGEADELERAQERARQGGGPILYKGAAYERFERFVGPAGAGGGGCYA